MEHPFPADGVRQWGTAGRGGGIGVGGKWVTKSGFVGELNLGFGRNLFNSENSNYNVVGKLAVTVGYRF